MLNPKSEVPIQASKQAPVERTGGPRPFASVVIPVYNALQWIRACLDSVLAGLEEYGAGEVIVVDNGSTDGTYEEIAQRYGRQVRLFQEPKVTISRLRNLGAAQASGELLVFIDSDCVMAPKAIEAAVEVLDRTQAAATGCMYDLPRNPHWIERTWDQLHRRRTDGWVNYLNSGNLYLRRSAFEQVGGFDEHLKTGEDAELCQRFWEHGLRIYEAHAVSAVHLGNPKSIGRFFGKQQWHALGMFGTAGKGLDKPVLMTVLHLLFVPAGLLFAAVAPAALGLRLLLTLALINLVPLVSIAFRVLRGGSLRHPLESLVLYHLYFAARVWALAKIVTRTA